MVLTPSTMQTLGIPAPDINLSTAEGEEFRLSEQVIEKGLLVVFMCNHCPYVKHIREKLVERIREYQGWGVTVVAINANDYNSHPDDNPEQMKRDSFEYGYTFPYLIDEDQSVAKAYGAACTPDFFLFDWDKKLVYRGQFDDARPSNDQPVSGDDLTAAVEQVVAGELVRVAQKPSMGCNIKWKEGNAPSYFG